MKTTRSTQNMRFLLLVVCMWGALAAVSPLRAQQNVFAEDARLRQQVAMNVEGLPLNELLGLLSQKTGVTLSVERDLADEKAIVFQKSRPLQETLSDLAALFNAAWTSVEVKGAGKRYLIVRARRADEQEAQLRRETTGGMLAQMEVSVQVANGAIVNTKNPQTEEELRHRFDAFPITRLAVKLYGLLTSEQRDLLFARHLLNLPYAALTQPQQNLALSFFDEAMRTNPSLVDRITNKYHDTPANMLEHNGLFFRLRGQTLGVEVGGAYRGAYCEVGTISGRSQWLLPPHGNPYTGTPIAAQEPLPTEKSMRDAAKTEGGWCDKLRTLAQTTDTPLFADYYRSGSVALPLDDPFPQTSRRADVQALDTLCKPENYLWWVRGRSVLLRKRNWYVQRLYEVPDRWVLSLGSQMDKRQVPTYADVLRLGELSGTQLAGLNLCYGSDAGTNNVEADTANLSGLPELLALMQERASPKGNTTSLPTLPPTDAQMLTYANMTAEQRNLLPNFIVAQEEPFSLQDSGPNGVKIWCYYQLPSRPTKTAMHVMIGYSLADTFRPFDLALPIRLADDRRERTKIEVTP